MGAILGGVGAAASAISGLGSLFGGGGSSSATQPQQYQLPNTNQAAQGALKGIQGQQNTLPQFQQLSSQISNNPFSTQATGNAQQTAQQGMQGASQLSGMGQSLVPYLQQILQQGFDPQNAYYNRAQQQLTDQVRSGEAARGIAMSPYGAGIENQANSNFNLDWQNQALQRALQGIQGASSLNGQIGQDFSGAYNLGSAAGSLPYNTQQGINQNSLAGLQSYFNAQQQPISNYLGYVGAGQQGQQLGLNAQNQGFNQGQTTGAGVGQALSTFGPGGTNAGFFNSIGNIFNPQQPTGYGTPGNFQASGI